MAGLCRGDEESPATDGAGTRLRLGLRPDPRCRGRAVRRGAGAPCAFLRGGQLHRSVEIDDGDERGPHALRGPASVVLPADGRGHRLHPNLSGNAAGDDDAGRRHALSALRRRLSQRPLQRRCRAVAAAGARGQPDDRKLEPRCCSASRSRPTRCARSFALCTSSAASSSNAWPPRTSASGSPPSTRCAPAVAIARSSWGRSTPGFAIWPRGNDDARADGHAPDRGVRDGAGGARAGLARGSGAGGRFPVRRAVALPQSAGGVQRRPRRSLLLFRVAARTAAGHGGSAARCSSPVRCGKAMPTRCSIG